MGTDIINVSRGAPSADIFGQKFRARFVYNERVEHADAGVPAAMIIRAGKIVCRQSIDAFVYTLKSVCSERVYISGRLIGM